MLLSLFLLGSLIEISVVKADLLYPYGSGHGDSQAGEGVTFFRTPKRLYFFGKRYKNLYICSNGLISFQNPYCPDYPLSIPNRTAVMAPFKIAQNISPPNAKIWYRASRDADTLKRAVSDLNNHFDGCKPSNFQPQQVVIITWQNVRQYDACLANGIPAERCDCLFNPPEYLDLRRVSKYCDCMLQGGNSTGYCECLALDKSNGTFCLQEPKGEFDHTYDKRDANEPTNTYQLVIISGETDTYVSLHYDRLDWISAKQLVPFEESGEIPMNYVAIAGFLGRDMPIYILPYSRTPAFSRLSTTSNVNVTGRHMFQLSSMHVLSPQCQVLDGGDQFEGAPLLYPFGPGTGDKAGPVVGFAKLQFQSGIPYFGQTYHNVWASSSVRVTFSRNVPENLHYFVNPGISVYKAHHDLLTSYQSDSIYSEYYSNYDNDLMLSEKFWYRVTSNPVVLGRAKADVQLLPGADADFSPTSVAIITWHRAMSVDECARHGFTPELCQCWLNFTDTPFCGCLIRDLFQEKPTFFNNYNDYSFADCGDSAVNGAKPLLSSGPYTEENTYQIVLATDSSSTYIILHYANLSWYQNHLLNKTYPEVEYAEVAIDNGSTDLNNTYKHPDCGTEDLLSLSQSTNVGVPGKYVFKASGPIM